MKVFNKHEIRRNDHHTMTIETELRPACKEFTNFQFSQQKCDRMSITKHLNFLHIRTANGEV